MGTEMVVVMGIEMVMEMETEDLAATERRWTSRRWGWGWRW